ncbi:MAG: TIGR03936 family radical SAM-associated protein [Candidatus Nanopelagicales bacterium]|nr:TIGR03936 family radical SAM-associated protein [Candidatus Nanopelagicales bacterium]MDZ4250566.1 TIGR03936 family radical SAM-associated protein [Candidatus Nanopelagicales bacterium]
MRKPPHEAQPVAQRLWLRYRKTDRMRFASHRDFQRSLERAVRRAGLPVASSGGFSPHPRISYTNAAPTGVASEAEYLELGLATCVDLGEVKDDLNNALPCGFGIVTVAPKAAGRLTDLLEASQWRLEFPGVAGPDMAAACDRLHGLAPVTVTRVSHKGRRDLIVTDALVSTGVTGEFSDSGGECAILHMVVRNVTPSVRPSEVLTALTEQAELVAKQPVLVTRLAQGPMDELGMIGDPLAVDL